MKSTTLWVALACVLLTASMALGQGQTKSLSNDDVIQMVSLGLSDDVIVEKIRTASVTDFDTSVAALKALKDGKVSDAVLKAMMNPHPAAQQTGRVVDELSTKFQTLKNGVFTVWSELGHGTGFLISSDGLVSEKQTIIAQRASDPRRDISIAGGRYEVPDACLTGSDVNGSAGLGCY